MSLIALPPIFKVTSFTLLQMNSVRTFSSPYGGSQTMIDLLNDRWKISMTVGITNYRDAAALEAFVNAQRSGVNTVNLYHYARPTPRGTAAGTLTLVGDTPAGSDSIMVAGGASAANKTLLAGDLLGISPQLLMLAANVTLDASGRGLVWLTNRLRLDQLDGASVILSYPTAPFRLASVPSVTYSGTTVGSMSLDYFEAVA